MALKGERNGTTEAEREHLQIQKKKNKRTGFRLKTAQSLIQSDPSLDHQRGGHSQNKCAIQEEATGRKKLPLATWGEGDFSRSVANVSSANLRLPFVTRQGTNRTLSRLESQRMAKRVTEIQSLQPSFGERRKLGYARNHKRLGGTGAQQRSTRRERKGR